jgi:hypothetical protein
VKNPRKGRMVLFPAGHSNTTTAFGDVGAYAVSWIGIAVYLYGTFVFSLGSYSIIDGHSMKMLGQAFLYIHIVLLGMLFNGIKEVKFSSGRYMTALAKSAIGASAQKQSIYSGSLW